MELLDYINSHMLTWEQDLAAEPYYLKITHDGPYVMLKYQQFISDMSNLLCQQARGAIFRLNEDKTAYIPVSIAMYKFFNSDEPYAAIIDWSSVVVQEKVDGSLIKFGYDTVEKHWLVSTNGKIRICDAPVTNNITYADIFLVSLSHSRILSEQVAALEDFTAQLDKNYTYYFELTSPETRIVCKYDYSIYYLGRRNMNTLEEDFSRIEFNERFNILYPRIYPLYNKKACLTAAKNLGENAEGFVVRDEYGHRVKIKSPWYLAMHHLRGNGRLSVKNVVEYWQNGYLDDYMAQFPESNEFITKVMSEIHNLIVNMENAWNKVADYENNRKEFAHVAFTYEALIRSYLFSHLDNHCTDAVKYVNDLRVRALSEYLENKLGV